jgi:hypothetical protein
MHLFICISYKYASLSSPRTIYFVDIHAVNVLGGSWREKSMYYIQENMETSNKATNMCNEARILHYQLIYLLCSESIKYWFRGDDLSTKVVTTWSLAGAIKHLWGGERQAWSIGRMMISGGS